VKETVGLFTEVNCARENCEAIVAPREHTIHRYFTQKPATMIFPLRITNC